MILINELFLFVLGLSFIYLIFYYSYFWVKFAFYKPIEPEKQNLPPVSVVICAKNESNNIAKNLPAILEQNYPDFEVVVVDDNSTDDTPYQLLQLKSKYPNLKVLRLQPNVNFFKGKKYPLALGIKEAKYEHLVLTDADCKPSSKNWLIHMASHFTEEKQIVLGYGAYSPKNSLLNYFIRFETLLTALQYFSYALNKIPYMGVGRNLAYTKTIFNQNKGFTRHYHIPSGDDDLFINQVANDKNTAICINPEAFTYSLASNSLLKYISQKRRHFTTGFYYKKKHKILLSSFYLSSTLFWTAFFYLLKNTNNYMLIFTLFFIKSAYFLLLIKKTENKLKEKNITYGAIFLELILLIFQLFIFITNKISRPVKWK